MARLDWSFLLLLACLGAVEAQNLQMVANYVAPLYVTLSFSLCHLSDWNLLLLPIIVHSASYLIALHMKMEMPLFAC